MSQFMTTRGRLISKSQVQVHASPVSLAERQKCVPRATAIRVETDPETGDLLEIRVECSCGEVTVIECLYDAAYTAQIDANS